MAITLPNTHQVELLQDFLNKSIPPARELIALKLQGKRLLILIENILIQHERLTRETIKTLKTLRVTTQGVLVLIALISSYLYVRRFHGYIFQGALYQYLMDRKLLVAVASTGLIFTFYLFVHRNDFMKSIATIS